MLVVLLLIIGISGGMVSTLIGSLKAKDRVIAASNDVINAQKELIANLELGAELRDKQIRLLRQLEASSC